MFNISKNKKVDDYSSVPQNVEIKGIRIPVIPLEKYPEIVIRVSSLIERISEELAKNSNKPLDEIMDNIAISDLLKYIPIIIRVAADELFDFIAYILDSEKERIKKLGLVDMTRIINRVYEVNQLADVQEEIRNFMKALKKQGRQERKDEIIAAMKKMAKEVE